MERDLSEIYLKGELIGRGGYASVYRARRIADGGEVAIKIHDGESAEASRASEREWEFMRCLYHPGIIRVEAMGKFEGHAAMAMEYFDGEPLSAIVPQRLSEQRIMAIMLRLTEALSYLHDAGLIHRDIKPSNILVRGDEIRLIDFGIASMREHRGIFDVTMTTSRDCKGTPAYMAPEAFTASAPMGKEGDIYALGLILLEMYTGKKAYEGDEFFRIAYEQVHRRAKIPSFVPRGIAHIVRKATEKRVSERYHDAGEMTEALTRYQNRRHSGIFRTSAILFSLIFVIFFSFLMRKAAEYSEESSSRHSLNDVRAMPTREKRSLRLNLADDIGARMIRYTDPIREWRTLLSNTFGSGKLLSSPSDATVAEGTQDRSNPPEHGVSIREVPEGKQAKSYSSERKALTQKRIDGKQKKAKSKERMRRVFGNRGEKAEQRRDGLSLKPLRNMP